MNAMAFNSSLDGSEGSLPTWLSISICPAVPLACSVDSSDRRSPRRVNHFAVPLVPDSRKLFKFLWLLFREVVLFTNILLEIIELRLCSAGLAATLTLPSPTARSFHQFPVSAAEGNLLAKSPEERLVRRAGLLAIQIRQKVHAIETPFRPGGDAGCRECSGQNIELDDGTVVHPAACDMSFPLYDPGHPNAAFPSLSFEAAQRAVTRSGSRRRSTVVT